MRNVEVAFNRYGQFFVLLRPAGLSIRATSGDCLFAKSWRSRVKVRTSKRIVKHQKAL